MLKRWNSTILFKCTSILAILVTHLFTGLALAQINPRAKEAFNKGNFSRAIELYEQHLKKTSKEDKSYTTALYNLAESYRLSGNYRMADSLHQMVDFEKASYWGYALTLLQQYRADKCHTFARHYLKYDAQHPELVQIEDACQLNKKKIDESLVVVKTIALPSKKERVILPGFFIGMYAEKELTARFDEYAGKRKDAAGTPNTAKFPLTISALQMKGLSILNYSLSNEQKVGYAFTTDYFKPIYNPQYYDLYKTTSISKKVFAPSEDLPDSLKSLSHYKQFPVYQEKEVIKQACLSADGNVLVFSSNKLKGEGGYDLYMSTLTSDGWTKPVNLSARINSTYNELYPFLSPNGMLYFSSNGHGGHGGYDIYSYDLTKADSAELENLPRPFNSAFDDYGYLYHEQSGFGLFASTRPNGIYSNQLFQFENKIINCDAKFVFKDYPEIKNRNANPKYCINFDMLKLQNELPKGKIYIWMMGDGKKNKGLKFTHCYGRPGIYKAKLLIYDPVKKTSDTTKITRDVVVTEKDFLKMEYTTKAKTAEFTTTSSQCKKCDSQTYYWDFGDGTYGCGFTVKHTYATYGYYTVRLVMKYKKDKQERSFECFERIAVEEKP